MRRSLLFAVLALPVGAACGGDAGGEPQAAPPVTAAAAAPAEAAGGASVSIDTFQFTPKQLTVEVGRTVEFTNNDNIAHTATAEGRFDLRFADKGATASHTFTEAGTYNYRCTLHPGMDATVIVR